MPIELRKVTEMVADPGKRADREDATRLLLELKVTLVSIETHCYLRIYN